MTGLLEIREKMKLIYSKNEVLILPVIKFVLAFLVLNSVNGQLGYMTRLDNVFVVLIVSLLCSFLPTGFVVLFAAIFSLLHMYTLSVEVALVGLCAYLLLYLLFLRFSTRESLVIVLIPLFFTWRIPYVMPLAMGLLGTPASALSVGCGVAVYYLITGVAANASTINTMGVDDAIAKVRLIIDSFLNNKEMLMMIAAFSITVLVVYMIRRMSIEHSWTIAILAGVMVNLVILLVGDLMYDINLSLLDAILGEVVAILLAKVIEFFRFCVDYSRTEKVQFEDDEYYYYVKAIPKMTVTAPTKTVKKINTQRRSSPTASQPNSNNGRSVITEHTSAGANAKSAYSKRNDYRSSGRSVTIGSNPAKDDDQGNDDYEELF